MVDLDQTHPQNDRHRWMDQSSCSGVNENEFLESSSLRITDESTIVMSEILQQAQTKSQSQPANRSNDANSINFAANALSAAGAAFLSAVLVNPLDVAKMFADLRCSPTCTRAGVQGTVSICPPDCFQYKGTVDVIYKIVRQEGITRLWRGTNAGLALAVPMVGIYLPFYDIFRIRMEEFVANNAPSMGPYVPFVAGALARSLACTTCYPIELARTRMQAFKETGKKPPGVLKTLIGIVSNVNSTTSFQSKLQNYRVLWTGLGAQLARDVPFSAICWSTLEPMRRKLCAIMRDEASAVTVLGSNFAAGFVAGSLAAGATVPLDVARTRRQIEKDPVKALRMTTRLTLIEIWRDGGMRGLFAGVGPRVARAGPSVGIVVSFYEVVKYVLNTKLTS